MIAENFLELLIHARQLGSTHSENNANNLSTKVLYLVSKKALVTPQDLLGELCLLKPNLTNLTKELILQKYIVRSNNSADRRNAYFTITEEGKNALKHRLKCIESNFDDLSDEKRKLLENGLEGTVKALKGE